MPPRMVRAPPVPRPEEFDEEEINSGDWEVKTLLSKKRLSMEMRGLAPLPASSLLGT